VAKPRSVLGKQRSEPLQVQRPALGRFSHLHAAQIVKHILGLTMNYGVKGFRLLYCWYAVPGLQAVRHRAEVEEFQAVAKADGVSFQATTYQDVILRLARA
jgi:hypothetical protein